MSSSRRALITGVTGQDGWYLSELLRAKGYEVFGLVRPSSTATPKLYPGVKPIVGDLLDRSSLEAALRTADPQEVYNLAAQSHVGLSFEMPEYTHQVNAQGVVNLLEVCNAWARESERSPPRFYQASTSELYGKVHETPQTERTPFHPRSPYAIAKAAAFYAVQNARERGMFACNGILFNHESPRRGVNFVTRKITRAAARGEKVELGNLSARRDWGYAEDYVRAMYKMLQADTPDDYVIATGVTHSVEDVARIAYERVGLNWRDYVIVNALNLRPTDVDTLCGDASKARRVLGWMPRVTFKELIEMMVDADVKASLRGE